MSFGALGALAGANIGKGKPPPGPNPATAGARAGAAPPPPSGAAAGALAGAQVGQASGPAQAPQATGGAAVNAFKQTSTYVNSVLSVFKAQNPFQQQKIVAGAAKNPNAPESKAVLDYVKSTSQQGAASGAAAGASAGGGVLAGTHAPATPASAPIKAAGNGIGGTVGKVLLGAVSPGPTLVAQGLASTGIHLTGTPKSTATVVGVPNLTSVPAFAGGKPTGPSPIQPLGVTPGAKVPVKDARNSQLGLLAPTGLPTAVLAGVAAGAGAAAHNPLGFLKNAGSDALNLVPNTVQGGYAVGKQLAGGNVGKAFSMVVDPYVKAFSGGLGPMLYNNPVTTGLMLAGPEAALGRGAGAVMRSGALGERAAKAADTARAPLKLGEAPAGASNPLVDLRSYSPNVAHKGLQVLRENRLRAKGLDPNVARAAPAIMPAFLQNALNVGLDARLRTIGNEEAGWRLRAGPEFRAQAIRAAKSVQPKDKVPANVVSFILQGAIRTPETAAADAISKIEKLTANAPKARSLARTQNRAQINDLTKFAAAPTETHAAAFKAAASLRQEIHAKDAVMAAQGMMPADQMLRSSLMQYAQDHMGAKPGPNGLEHPNGDLVTTAQIEKHMQTHNPNMPQPAYVGHYPSKGAFWNYYSRYKLARGNAGFKGKSGYAYRTGAYDHTYDGLIAQQAKTAEAITKASLHDRIVNRASVGKPTPLQKPGENGMYTPGEARIAAHNAYFGDDGMPRPGAQQWVPMTASPAGTLKAVSEIQHPSQLVVPAGHEMNGLNAAQLDAARSYELNALQHSLNDAQIRTDGTRNVVLIPKVLADQLVEQFAPAGKYAAKIGHVTQQFRRTVLPYSTHWMGQIGTEALLRSLVAGVVDPRNIIAGHQLMKEWSAGFKGVKASTRQTRGGLQAQDVLGRSAARETTGATFYNRHDQLAKHNPTPGRISGFAHAAPGIRELIRAHNAYADGVGAAMGRLEREFRIMALGKYARKEAQEFTKSYQWGARLQGKALAQLAERGRTDPAFVAKLGRQVDDALGKYRNLSPTVRAATQSVAPFLPWYLNAAKFVFWNLPVKHPVASSLLASVRQTLAQDIQDGQQAPLGKFAEEALARVTPFGILPQPATPDARGVGSEVARLGTGVVLPQAAGSFMALLGLDPFGQPLKGPSGKIGKKSGKPILSPVAPFSPQGISSAANQALQSFFPAVRQAQLAREGGAKSYNTATLWNPQPNPGEPQGVSQALNRIFNPLYAFNSAQRSDASNAAFQSAKAGKKSMPSLPKLPELPQLPKLPG